MQWDEMKHIENSENCDALRVVATNVSLGDENDK